jgi:hypothetical protein
MQAFKGKLFLQLSGATLCLIATSIVQNQSIRFSSSDTASTTQKVTYQSYSEVLDLLQKNQPVAAAELLAAIPDEHLGISHALMREMKLTYSPEALFIQIGRLFTNQASQAAFSGSAERAKLLITSCQTLQHRLERGAGEETPREHERRLLVIQCLKRFTKRSEAILPSLS